MSEAGLILAINLVLGFSLFAAFLGFHVYRPANRQYFCYSLSFAAAMCSGGLELALPLLHSSLPVRYAIFASFLACEVWLARGLARQYGAPERNRTVATIAVAGLLLNVVTLFLARNSLLRMVLYQLPYVALAAVCTLTVWRAGRHRLGDRALAVLLALFTLHFASRPMAAFLSGGMGPTASAYLSTVYAVTTQFDVAVLTIGIAATLLALAVSDTIRELESGLRSDALTGILNRSGFDLALRERLAARQLGHSCLMSCDLDHFKSINDTFGHAAGDAVIRAFAETLRDATGDRGLCGRIGGEEFAILIENAEPAAARLFVEKVRLTFASRRIDGLPDSHVCTASFGITAIAGPDDVEAAFARADAALYAAKAKGRNRAETAPSSARSDVSVLRVG